MPAFIVTAVDITNNTLTATGVAATAGAPGTVVLTGDRLRLRNVGGALPAATPALAPVTDYFAIRVDDNTIKLSDTNAHALAGTGIVDLTGTGSGTTTIEFGLPYCIPTEIAVNGVSQVRAEHLNAVWQALVALYGLLTAQAQAVWSTIVVAVTVTFNAGATAAANQHFTVSGTGQYKHGTRTIKVPINAPRTGSSPGFTGEFFNQTGATQTSIFAIPWLPVGATILGARARIKDSATGPTTVRIQIVPSVDGTYTASLGASSSSAGTGAVQTISISGLTAAVAALTTYHVFVDTMTGSAQCSTYAIEVDYDQR